MNGNTLILDAFWVSNKYSPTSQIRDSKEGEAFYRYYPEKARYLGWMDLVLLKDIIKKNNINHIILKNLDALGQIAQKIGIVNVCVAYENQHIIVNTFSQEIKLKHCKPIYENVVFGGWNFADDDEYLHPRAQYYIRYLLTHTRVDFITCMNNKIKVTACWNDLGKVIFETEPNI